MIGLLCKGSTTDFDSVCLGSNPGNPTKILNDNLYKVVIFFSDIPCYATQR